MYCAGKHRFGYRVASRTIKAGIVPIVFDEAIGPARNAAHRLERGHEMRSADPSASFDDFIASRGRRVCAAISKYGWGRVYAADYVQRFCIELRLLWLVGSGLVGNGQSITRYSKKAISRWIMS
jgi:hypothetical protein